MILPFKQYLESKEKLRKALNETSKITRIYKVKKYCKLPINENDKKEYLPLKPNDTIQIIDNRCVLLCLFSNIQIIIF